MGRCRRLGLALAAAMCFAACAGRVCAEETLHEAVSLPTADAQSIERTPLALRRVLKVFDFNEREFGNYGTVPLGWRHLEGRGFPIYLEGRFDPEVGHTAPPSFRLDLNGGSLAYRYEGRDIAVRPNSDYFVVAWVRTEGLRSARAFVTSTLLDREGELLPGTEQQSALVGGPDSSDQWTPLTLRFRCEHPDARYMGLTLWLAQRSVWRAVPPAPHEVGHQDIHGTAWFDDIVVYRMPRAALRTSRPGGVFVGREVPELEVELSDPDGLHLEGALIVRDADGQTVDERSVPVRTRDDAPIFRVAYDALPIGLYEAEFTVRAAGATLIHHSLRFARLAERVNLSDTAGRGFGVMLTDVSAPMLDAQRELLAALEPQWAKVPVWYAQQAVLDQPEDPAGVDAYLEAIRQMRCEPVGVMMDVPSLTMPRAGDGFIRMFDLLSADPIAWRPLIAGLWSRAAGLVSVWQLGDEHHWHVTADDRAKRLIERLRVEMADLMAEPVLASVASARIAPGSQNPADLQNPADFRSVLLPNSVDPERIGLHLEGRLAPDPRRVWVTVEPLEDTFYPRVIRMDDWTLRLVETYFQGVGGVFVRAPWDPGKDRLDARTDPREEYIVFRTVSNILGDATPVARMPLNGRVQCRVFDQGGIAILCVWDPRAPREGIEHRLAIGENVQQVDPWGRRSVLPTVGGRQVVRIGPTPTFLLYGRTWLLEFQRAFAVNPSQVDARFDPLSFEVEFRNTWSAPISGSVRLALPEPWEVRPYRITFSLRENEVFRQRLDVRFPPNAQCGLLPLVGEFDIDADRHRRFIAHTWFDFGPTDIDIHAIATRSDEHVTVRVDLANRTDRPVHFEGYLLAPDHPRVERQFSNCQPGQRVTRMFVIPNAAELAGRDVRISLKEINGLRFWNQVITIP